MKNFSLLAVVASLIITLTFCKNTPLPEGQTVVSGNTPSEIPAPLATPPAGKTDTLHGFKGCEKASWSVLAPNLEEFVYQHYTVRVSRNEEKPGEQITVGRDSGRADFVIPMPDDGYFKGVARNKLFVDAGTGPDGRELFIFDLDKKTQYYRTPYCGEPEVYQYEKLYYLVPVEEKEVLKMPDCPEKESWKKNGLSVGYGQRCLFNLRIRSLTKKSEWACVPKQ
jgi:hypothetical protein